MGDDEFQTLLADSTNAEARTLIPRSSVTYTGQAADVIGDLRRAQEHLSTGDDMAEHVFAEADRAARQRVAQREAWLQQLADAGVDLSDYVLEESPLQFEPGEVDGDTWTIRASQTVRLKRRDEQ